MEFQEKDEKSPVPVLRKWCSSPDLEQIVVYSDRNLVFQQADQQNLHDSELADFVYLGGQMDTVGSVKGTVDGMAGVVRCLVRLRARPADVSTIPRTYDSQQIGSRSDRKKHTVLVEPRQCFSSQDRLFLLYS